MKIEKGKYYKYINELGDYVHTVYATSDGRDVINEKPEFSGIVVLATRRALWKEGHVSSSWGCECFVESDMTELVEEARKRFPEGSRYHSVDVYGNGGSSYTITRIPDKYLHHDEWTIEGGDCFLLYKGRWAEPFLKEEVKSEFDMPMTTNEVRLAYARKHYPIGTKYIGYDFIGSPFTSVSESVYQARDWKNGRGIECGTALIYHHDTNQWAKIISKPNETEKVMEKQTLTREQVKEIYDIACSDWKKIIDKYVLDNTGTFSNEVTFDNEMVIKMFNAATETQRPVLKRLFKEPELQIKFNPSNVYIYKGLTGCGTYKLHRISDGTYAWIDIYTSDCYANGIHQSGHTALQSILNQGCKVEVLKGAQEVIEYFKSL
jgi:hypothetical protein